MSDAEDSDVELDGMDLAPGEDEGGAAEEDGMDEDVGVSSSM